MFYDSICLLLLKKTCVRPLSERETYRRFTLVVFLYWRKSYNCSEVLSFCNKCQLRKRCHTGKHVVAYAPFFFFVSLLKENLSNKKGKNGKKREKSYFHVFSIKQRCLLENLDYFSLFPFFPQKSNFLFFFLRMIRWHTTENKIKK